MLHALFLATTIIAAAEPATAPPSSEPAGAETPVSELPPIPANAKAVLDRMIAHFAPLPGIKVIAKHRIQAPNNIILHESVRNIVIVKPNKINVAQDGIPFLVSNGVDAWTLPQQGVIFNEQKAPATMPECIAEFRALGNGGIGGSGGLVAALLSPNALGELLKEVDQVSSIQRNGDDLLILRIGPNAKRLREGLRLGIFVPQTGDPWPAQLDVIPPKAEVFTRIAFSDWSIPDVMAANFEKPEVTAPTGTFNPTLALPTKKGEPKPATPNSETGSPADSPPDS
ncbi:MAG: hypothetical protein QGI75_02585 [Phycisphaerales bacterium]|jgi:hypothetical protein|nr:hypothetical protein [Phycisphaerales bacterium]MDP6891209.1 hypothetical protein [Phycisphaerales bacterium]